MPQSSPTDIARFQRAHLKIIEAKAQLWATLNAFAALAFLAVVVGLIALLFKLVLG